MEKQKPRSVEEHIRKLKEKGMVFPNEKQAKDFLSRVSYFRLKYYWMDMRDTNIQKTCFKDTTFNQVVLRYKFDHKLRLILFDAIEIIEVALRAKIIYHMSKAANNGLWYLDSSLFESKKFHYDFVIGLKNEFNRSTEPFAKEYLRTHTNWDKDSFNGDNPEAWMIIEVATFGTLSKMYKNLKNQLPQRSDIAKDFGLYSSKDFSNWLEVISLLRNIVAHHSRIWNRSFSKQIINIKRHRDKWINKDLTWEQKNRLYGTASAMIYLCNAVDKNNSIKKNILDLINQCEDIPLSTLGFYEGWKDEPIWE